MNIIKLDAIGSTNVYLKELLTNQNLENFTVVVAEHQTQGKGQRGAIWTVDPGSNLTFSVLVRDLLVGVELIYDLNIMVALSVYHAVEKLKINNLSIKWPNDILAGNKKIGGILIENIIKSDREIYSIVGIGLNVNQKRFKSLPYASSLSLLMGKDELDKTALMYAVLEKMVFYFNALKNGRRRALWKEYHGLLYKKGVPMMFEDSLDNRFMGIIQGVNEQGSLVVRLENGNLREFFIKEVRMLY